MSHSRSPWFCWSGWTKVGSSAQAKSTTWIPLWQSLCRRNQHLFHGPQKYQVGLSLQKVFHMWPIARLILWGKGYEVSYLYVFGAGSNRNHSLHLRIIHLIHLIHLLPGKAHSFSFFSDPQINAAFNSRILRSESAVGKSLDRWHMKDFLSLGYLLLACDLRLPFLLESVPTLGIHHFVKHFFEVILNRNLCWLWILIISLAHMVMILGSTEPKRVSCTWCEQSGRIPVQSSATSMSTRSRIRSASWKTVTLPELVVVSRLLRKVRFGWTFWANTRPIPATFMAKSLRLSREYKVPLDPWENTCSFGKSWAFAGFERSSAASALTQRPSRNFGLIVFCVKRTFFTSTSTSPIRQRSSLMRCRRTCDPCEPGASKE